MSAPPLSASATSALQAAVILLRDTRGFMFLPMFADSERAASSGLDFLKSQLASEFYTVAWPLDRQLPITHQRVQLLANLDDAIGKLPPDTVVVLDATGSLRKDLALEVIAYVNHRREPLRSGGLRLVLCWPVALKDELLSNAPDLWSVRAASPWVEQVDLMPVTALSTAYELSISKANANPISAAMADKLQLWQQLRDLKKANLSSRDALKLANSQYSKLKWASASELAEAVFFAVEGQPYISADVLALVESLNVLSSARSRLGNLSGALEASRRAVLEAYKLAEENPTAYDFVLAGSISNLANRLSETGDRVGALKAAQEAVEIRRRLAKIDPTAYEPSLAASMNNLAKFLSEIGDRKGALKASFEAVGTYKRLVMANLAASEPDLAMSINNLSGFLSDDGDRAGALNAAREAVSIYKRLAKTAPAAYEPDLAVSINTLANRLSENKDHRGALKVAQKALGIHKHLVKINPAANEPCLAGCMSNLANFLSENGDRSAALKATHEAVDIRRRLAKTNPAAYDPELAGSINNLAKFLIDTGDRPGALKAAQEAVALYEKVNKQTPGAFDKQLAIAKRVLDGLTD